MGAEKAFGEEFNVYEISLSSSLKSSSRFQHTLADKFILAGELFHNGNIIYPWRAFAIWNFQSFINYMHNF